MKYSVMFCANRYGDLFCKTYEKIDPDMPFEDFKVCVLALVKQTFPMAHSFSFTRLDERESSAIECSPDWDGMAGY